MLVVVLFYVFYSWFFSINQHLTLLRFWWFTVSHKCGYLIIIKWGRSRCVHTWREESSRSICSLIGASSSSSSYHHHPGEGGARTCPSFSLPAAGGSASQLGSTRHRWALRHRSSWSRHARLRVSRWLCLVCVRWVGIVWEGGGCSVLSRLPRERFSVGVADAAVFALCGTRRCRARASLCERVHDDAGRS